MIFSAAGLDVVEDEDVILSNIRNEFGDDVATLVDGASEPEELINAIISNPTILDVFYNLSIVILQKS
jgi:(p)ppGpp synthase/HD superfamily hydrolase